MTGWQPQPGWDPNALDILHIGTRVKFRYVPGRTGRVVEWRGPLAPGGVQVYGIRFGPKGNRRYTEARRDQLVVLPPKPAADPPA